MRAAAPLLIGVTLLVSSPRTATGQAFDASPAEKSVSTGVVIGLAGIAIPLAAAAAGNESAALIACILGPFPGLAYAGDAPRGLKGMAFRGAVLGGTILIGAAAAPDWLSDKRDEETLSAIFLLGAAGTLFSWGVDLSAIPDRVRRQNALRVSPTLGRDGRIGMRLDLRW
jgi:hypothetical protein